MTMTMNADILNALLCRYVFFRF